MWLGTHHGYAADLVTQRWVQLTGRRVDLRRDAWLAGPTGSTRAIGAGFFEHYARRTGRELLTDDRPRGLVPDICELLHGARVHAAVADFYQATSEYDMDCWCEWSPVFRPFGQMLSVLFSRRLEQLNVPLGGLDTHRGIASRVVAIRAPDGTVETAWIRQLVASKRTLYAGSYSLCRIPGHAGNCIRVCFPLPNGRAMVIMRPEVDEDGSMTVISDGSGFGDPGFYFVVERNGTTWARYVATMKESIHVYAAEDGLVRADHGLRIWGRVFLRLHYRLSRRTRQT